MSKKNNHSKKNIAAAIAEQIEKNEINELHEKIKAEKIEKLRNKPIPGVEVGGDEVGAVAPKTTEKSAEVAPKTIETSAAPTESTSEKVPENITEKTAEVITEKVEEPKEFVKKITDENKKSQDVVVKQKQEDLPKTAEKSSEKTSKIMEISTEKTAKKPTKKSGILLHISSLPSKHGIGKLGKAAFDFIDFLSAANVKYWQVLPLQPTSYGDSPYQSFSNFAGNPYFIDFEILKSDGILKKSDYESIKWEDIPISVNYRKIYENVFKVLRIAFKNYRDDLSTDYFKFCEKNKFWLDDYALFMALKFKNDGKAWYEWASPLAMRDSVTIAKTTAEMRKEIDFFKFVQYKFFAQWENVKKYAAVKGVEIIGDVPIYVAYDSVEVWTHPELFQVDDNKRPIDVAGCPPDDFSPTGQLWGNPLYDWNYHKGTKFKWWIERLKYITQMYDVTRIDHFRGFSGYYAIPFGDITAEHGEWREGPGAELFKQAEKQLGRLPLIAEDLGFLTEDVCEMLRELGYPGMKILQFAFDGKPDNEYLPHNYKTSNLVVYTGTHDNPTLQSWIDKLNKKNIKYIFEYTDVEKKKYLLDKIIRLAWSSVAETVIVPMQDFLKLGDSARMNTPSTLGFNWLWRMTEKDLTKELIEKIKHLNKFYNRA